MKNPITFNVFLLKPSLRTVLDISGPNKVRDRFEQTLGLQVRRKLKTF